ncbi:hypothetical protein TNCV_1613921 [Trichonephila clavipes]|nr:hypothetical protein TNCV_1613921 [Trichonephila clavipes]
MADCEVEGTIASPLSIPLERAMSPTGERSDEGTSEPENPFGPQERQTRISKAGIENAITPNQATQNNDVILHLPMTSNLFSFDRAEEECPRCEELKKCSLFSSVQFSANTEKVETWLTPYAPIKF